MMFRIYYDSGIHTDKLDKARTDGVQFVAEIREDGRKFVHMGGEFFLLKDGIWRCSAIERAGYTSYTGKLINTVIFQLIKRDVFEWILSV